MKKKRVVSIIGIAAAFQVLAAVPALAATINSVTIGFRVNKEAAGTVREAYPTPGAGSYEITEWSCSKDPVDWVAGQKVSFDIVIEPTKGNNFSSSKTKLKVSGANGEISGAGKQIKSNRITCKVSYWPTIEFAAPENLYFDDDYIAHWDKVAGCGAYEIKVTTVDDNDKKKTKTLKSNKTEIDLSQYASEAEVTFSVRAVAKNETQKKYVTASTWTSCNDEMAPASDNTAVGTFRGSSDSGITFKNTKGVAVSGWQKINGVWYYFDSENKNRAVTKNWKNIGGKWYWFDANGAMQTGWIPDGTYWYYCEQNESSANYGAMKTGWICAGPTGPWYYLNGGERTDIPFGAMYADALTPDGYYVGADGKWVP